MSTRARVGGSPPPPAPPVRRYGKTALMVAAANDDDDRAIVAALLGARAAVDTKDGLGCAICRRPIQRVVGGGRRRWRPCPPRPAGGRRCTMRRPRAASAPARSCSSAAPIRASRTSAGSAVPPPATPAGRTPDRCRKTPRQLAQIYNLLGAYDAAVAQARPPHRCRRIARASPASGPLAGVGTAMHARTTRMHRRSTHCMPRPRSSLNADAPAA